MLEIENSVIEMKNAFDGLISRLDMADERISELEGMSIETPKTEQQREKKNENKAKKTHRKKTHSSISKNCGTTRKVITYLY